LRSQPYLVANLVHLLFLTVSQPYLYSLCVSVFASWVDSQDDYFAFWPLLRKILTSAPLLERFQKMDPELGAMDRGAEVKYLGAMDYGAEVDDMVNGVTSKILHLPPRRRRSRRRGGKCKICVFSLFLFYIFNKQIKNKLHLNPPYHNHEIIK
jgi:uncharacterized protein YggT (Ycf19 family)